MKMKAKSSLNWNVYHVDSDKEARLSFCVMRFYWLTMHTFLSLEYQQNCSTLRRHGTRIKREMKCTKWVTSLQTSSSKMHSESSCSVAQSSQHHPHLRHKYMAHCKRTELHIYYLYESKWSCRRTSSQLFRRAVKKLSKQRSERSSRSRLARSSAHVSIWTLWALSKDDSQRRLYRWYKLSFAWDLLTWKKKMQLKLISPRLSLRLR